MLRELRYRIACWISPDIADVEHRFSCVLGHATGGRMSKTNYDWEIMQSAINDHLASERNDAFEEGRIAGFDEGHEVGMEAGEIMTVASR